jgi:hypothetical protein
VHLEPRAVELPLDRGGTDARERVVQVVSRLREHRLDRAQNCEPEARQPLRALAERRRRDRSELAGEHDRPPHLRGREVCGPRDRLDHDPLERALPELAQEEPDEEALLRLGRAREESRQLVAARGLGPRSRDARDARRGRVDVEQLKRRGRRSRLG